MAKRYAVPICLDYVLEASGMLSGDCCFFSLFAIGSSVGQGTFLRDVMNRSWSLW